MGEWTELAASDGHAFKAYRAAPTEAPVAGVIVVQEIFGITEHIRRVTDQFANLGFLAVAPSLFDRVQADTILDYSEIERGREIMQRLELDQVILDVESAVASCRSAGKVGAVGYCWGGAIVDLAACNTGIDAGVAYYGRMIVEWLESKPACPVMYHFGEQDPLIPAEMVDQIRDSRPEGIFHTYPDAGHGFNCDERADFHPQSAQLALERSLEFFRKYL